jgi:hypothetical protein
MIKTSIKSTFAAFAALVLGAASVVAGNNPPAAAATLDVKTGATTLTLADTFQGVLQLGQVDLVKVIPGKINPGKGTLSFPISGGVFDTLTAESEITHSGGFSLATGNVKVSLTDFVISTPEAGNAQGVATLSALVTVNASFQGRVVLFNLDLSGANISVPVTVPKNKILVLKSIDLTLTTEGAAALNAAFGTTLPAGTVVGSAEVKAITQKGSL